MPAEAGTGADDLVRWLHALLEEQAETARVAVSSYRGVDREQQVHADAGDRFRTSVLALADLQAKVRIVELHREPHACRVERSSIAAPFHPTEWTQRTVERSAGPCQTLRLLAAPYWGWPGWRDEWAP